MGSLGKMVARKETSARESDVFVGSEGTEKGESTKARESPRGKVLVVS